MNDHLDELLNESRQWARQRRGADVVLAAIEFLRTHFHIDAGFFTYERQPRKETAEYKRGPSRWFTSWGYNVPEIVLRRAVSQSMDFQSKLKSRQWFGANELPPVWEKINKANEIQHAGLWLMEFEGEPVGLFVLARKSMETDDSQTISRAMAHISLVLELVLERGLAEELAVRDPLTSLFNRRGFLKEFDTTLKHASGPLTLAVLDVDSFKKINDHYGHQAGDEYLTRVGAILQNHATKYDGVCARIGGDEFILLGHIGVTNVYRAADTVSSWFQQEGISISVGCAVIGQDGSNFDACYHVADGRLYEMKEQHDRL